MARERYPDLIDELAIVQGETYLKLVENNSIWFTGDVTNATLKGQIRRLHLEDEGELLTSFIFQTSIYNEAQNKTFIKPYLPANYTTFIPRTAKYRTGRDPNIKTNYIYDIELTLPGGEILKNAYGFVEVIGEVTNDEQIYDPPIVWNGSVDHISLTESFGLADTYTVWGDAAETINLGTFQVKNADGVGIAEANYDPTTGILTFAYSDGNTFATQDIRGEPGISVYQVALNNGFVGSEQDWLDSLLPQWSSTNW